MIVRALYQPDRQKFEKDAYPGSFHLQDHTDPTRREFHYFCPCGCGGTGRIIVSDLRTPGGTRARWNWNGSTTEPTLEPGIGHQCFWGGLLRNGYWEKC